MPQIKSNNVEVQNYYIHNGIKYIVDNKKVVVDYSEKELEVAEWLATILKSKVKLLPKINWPEKIKTPDYLINNEKWDLKEIKNATSKTRAIDNAIKNQEKQASNFIIDVSEWVINDDLIIQLLKKVFSPLNTQRLWIKKIIVKRNNKVVCYFKRK